MNASVNYVSGSLLDQADATMTHLDGDMQVNQDLASFINDFAQLHVDSSLRAYAFKNSYNIFQIEPFPSILTYIYTTEEL